MYYNQFLVIKVNTIDQKTRAGTLLQFLVGHKRSSNVELISVGNKQWTSEN